MMSVKTLYDAVRQTDQEKVSMLLDNPGLVKQLNKLPKDENETILTLAAMLNDDVNTADLGKRAPHCIGEIVRLLINKGADPCTRNFSGKAALHLCGYEGKAAACQALLESGADPDVLDDSGKPPIYWAILRSHLDVVKLLLNNKARVDLPINTLGDSVAHEAIMTSNIDIVNEVLSKNPNPNLVNSRGEGLLYFCALTDRDTVARTLLDQGADILHLSKIRTTPIHACARLNHVKVLELLVNHKDMTREFIDMQLSKDTDVINGKEMTITNWTALHLASAQGHKEALELLLGKDANPEIKSGSGRTALQLAEEYKKVDIIVGLGGEVPEEEIVAESEKDKNAKTSKATDVGPGWRNFAKSKKPVK